jgi:hypothetical protein
MNAFMFFPNDESLTFECQTEKNGEKRRFVLSIEKDNKKSFWFIVSNRKTKPMKQGDLTDLKPDEIKKILQYEVVNGK